jgi:hypothetical protein
MYNFRDSTQKKDIQSTEFDISNVKGDFSLDLKYRVSVSDRFYNYGSMSYFSPYQICSVPEGEQLRGLTSSSFPSVNFGSPEEKGCNPVTKDLSESFRKIQYQLTITGRKWALSQIICRAVAAPQNIQGSSCTMYKPVEVINSCENDWYLMSENLCQTQ